MFKRLLNWLFPPKTPDEGYYTYVLVRGSKPGPQHYRWVKQWREAIPTTPVMRTQPLPDNYVPPKFIVPHGGTEAEKRAQGRAKMIAALPDECTFL